MNDATLNPQPDARQGDEVDLVRIVEFLQPELGPLGRPPAPLEGGITNRNYRASFGGREYVIRIPGKDTGLLGIDREAEAIANRAAASVGVAPPVAATLTDPPAFVTEFIEGRGLDARELRSAESLALVAGALKAVHGLDVAFKTDFSAYRVVDAYAATTTERGGSIPGRFDEARSCAERIERALTGGEHEPVPCHNDLLAANFILAGERMYIVDWEYAGMGNRYFDLANFAVNNELGEGAQEYLLEQYFGFPSADPREPARRLAALRLMCFMSDFREAMWGVVQQVVSDLDFDFADYADRHFDRLSETMADNRFRQWLEEAEGVGTG
jgi:thiamine kinase-like enzyme